MNQEEVLSELRAVTTELAEQQTTPALREQLLLIRSVLDEEEIDLSLRVERIRMILDELEELSSLDMTTRTQLWSVSALIEQL